MIEYKKSTGVLVFNGTGELALQLRAANDDSFPGHWDFSAGGGIDPGEDPKLAAERELKEELGVEVEVNFLTVEHFIYPAWQAGVTREVDLLIYKAPHDGPFQPDPKEVAKVEFFTLAKIQDMIKAGEKFHPEFLLSWNQGIMLK